jgi:SNF2 family DNA or RNA helicase
MQEFVQQWAKPIELHRDEQKLEQLKKLTQPFMLRRLKTDPNIISDLPPKARAMSALPGPSVV